VGEAPALRAHTRRARAHARARSDAGHTAEGPRADHRQDQETARPRQEPASDRRRAQPAPHTDRAGRLQMASQLRALGTQPNFLRPGSTPSGPVAFCQKHEALPDAGRTRLRPGRLPRRRPGTSSFPCASCQPRRSHSAPLLPAPPRGSRRGPHPARGRPMRARTERGTVNPYLLLDKTPPPGARGAAVSRPRWRAT
jgi:hypothetical protein